MPRRTRCAGRCNTSTPSIRTRPLVGSSIRLIIRSVVVLPLPDDPTSTVTVPDGISNESESTATLPSRKRFVTCSSSITRVTLGGRATAAGRVRTGARRPRDDYGAAVITHLVLFRLNDDTTAEQAEEFYRRLCELPSLVPGLDDFHPGRDLGLRPGNAQFGLRAHFADAEAFTAYATHPQHVAFIDECVTPWATRVGIQFED